MAILRAQGELPIYCYSSYHRENRILNTLQERHVQKAKTQTAQTTRERRKASVSSRDLK